MSSAIRILINFLAVAVLVLVLTGGYVFELPKAKIDLSDVGAWAALLLVISFVLYQKSKLKNPAAGVPVSFFLQPWFTRRAAQYFLVFMCALIFVAHTLKHWSLKTHGYDVSYVHQALFHPLDGSRVLAVDVSKAKTVLGDHLAFSFMVLAPLTSLLPYDEVIFLLQVILAGLTVWAFLQYGPVRKYGQYFLIIAAIILAHRGLRSGMYFDFREDLLAFVGLSAMILSLYRKNIGAYLAGFALALLSKENIFAVTLFFVFPILFSQQLGWNKKERRALALFTAFVSLLYGFAAFKFYIPYFAMAKKGDHPIFARYGFAGGTVPEIVWAILTTPAIWWKLLANCFQKSDLKYLVMLILPFAYFYRSREAWIWFAVAIPGILMNISHDYTAQTMMVFHYELIILPGLIAALLFGMEPLLKKESKVSPLYWGLLIALCFSGKWPGYFVTSNIPTKEEFAVHQEFKALDVNTPVMVGMRYSAQVNHLKNYGLLSPSTKDLEDLETYFDQYKDVKIWIIDPDGGSEKAVADFLLTKGYQKHGTLVWFLTR